MGQKRTIQGVVVSNKTPKTITVELTSYKKHPKYKKRVSFKAKYYAHDENNIANVGDVVTIEECRPLSALKRFKLVSVDKKALEDIKVMEEREVEELLHKEEKEESEGAKEEE